MELTEEQIRQNREAWLQQLESGEDEQVQGVLSQRDKVTGAVKGFCCLGVACEVAGVEKTPDPGSVRVMYGAYGNTQELPVETREWLGVMSGDPELAWPVGHKNQFKTLAALNDSGIGFPEIAAYVRAFGFRTDIDVLKEER